MSNLVPTIIAMPWIPVHDWVSVHDELPPREDGLRVLVFTENHKFGNGCQFFDILANDFYDVCPITNVRVNFVASAATHWKFHSHPPMTGLLNLETNRVPVPD